MALLVQGGSITVEETKAPQYEISEGEQRITRSVVVKEENDPPDMTTLSAAFAELFPANTVGGRFPTGADLFVKSATAREESSCVTESQGVSVPSHWRFKITYGPANYNVPTGTPSPTNPLPYLEMREEIGGEYQTVNAARLYWDQEVDPIGDESVTATKRVDTNNFVYTRQFYKPTSEMRALMNQMRGTVNEEDFPDDHVLFPGVKKWQLLFVGASLNASFNTDGSQKWSTSLSLAQRSGLVLGDGVLNFVNELSWNHVWNQKLKFWDVVYRVPHDADDSQNKAGNQLYMSSPNTDFENLFLL